MNESVYLKVDKIEAVCVPKPSKLAKERITLTNLGLAFETSASQSFYDGQITLSTELIKPKFCFLAEITVVLTIAEYWTKSNKSRRVK